MQGAGVVVSVSQCVHSHVKNVKPSYLLSLLGTEEGWCPCEEGGKRKLEGAFISRAYLCTYV